MSAQTEQIEIIIGEGLPKKESFFGHMAISINNTVYSQFPGEYFVTSHNEAESLQKLHRVRVACNTRRKAHNRS